MLGFDEGDVTIDAGLTKTEAGTLVLSGRNSYQDGTMIDAGIVQVSADYDASSLQAFGELGYRIETATVSYEPFVGLAHLRLKTDGFTERGGTACRGTADRDQLRHAWRPGLYGYPFRGSGRHPAWHAGLASRLWRYHAAVASCLLGR
ncbi:autotransporter domain-containing protein [Paracoccus saliphilus]|uniref:Autotransporter domain-containing protein n=1 Tax=Paracoccus saliphilus TaxID=405559 RepID=A0ABY7S5A4_9RHOB|nr:autotransporter domain-containing protein [Paracoccus saliphilus]